MTAGKQRTIKALAFCLAFSVVHFYARASSERPAAQTQNPATRAPQGLGLLSTTGDREILVDKNKVDTGATILDGARLETMACTSGTVRWGTLDRVDLATNTIAVIHYQEGMVKVTLERGCAKVRVQQGVSGSIDTPDGKTIPATLSDTLNRQRAEVCYPSNNREDFNPHCIPPVVWIFGGGGAAAATVATATILRGRNPSPRTP